MDIVDLPNVAELVISGQEFEASFYEELESKPLKILYKLIESKTAEITNNESLPELNPAAATAAHGSKEALEKISYILQLRGEELDA